MTSPQSPQRAAVLGALVADAAALGLHWLYDQDRVNALGGDTPEFLRTAASDYDGSMAFFAHAKKIPGDFTQYGEQAMVMLQSLAACDGAYRKPNYEEKFTAVFGYGGDYVGYIDRPTRDTLNNLVRAENEALAAARALPFTGTASDQNAMITKVTANLKKHQGQALHDAVEQAVRLTHDNDDSVAYARQLTDTLSSITGYFGADDEQLPAVSKLPPLVARYAGDADLVTHVESAVRVTNNNDLAVASGLFTARLLESTFETGDISAALDTATQERHETLAPLLDTARARRTDPATEVTRDFGMSCNLLYGIPSAVHTLETTSSFTDAVRTNIFASGDTCGRAMLIGAVAGAAYGIGGDNGVPEAWIEKLTRRTEVEGLLEAIGLT